MCLLEKNGIWDSVYFLLNFSVNWELFQKTNINLNFKRLKKIHYTNTSQKKAGRAKSVSDKVDIMIKRDNS